MRHREAVEWLVLIDAPGFPMTLPIYIGLFNSALMRVSSPWQLSEVIIRSAVRNVYGDPRKIDGATLRRHVEFFHGEGTRAAIGKIVPIPAFKVYRYQCAEEDAREGIDHGSLVRRESGGESRLQLPTTTAHHNGPGIPRIKSIAGLP